MIKTTQRTVLFRIASITLLLVALATVATAQPAFRLVMVADHFADGSTAAALSGDTESIDLVGSGLIDGVEPSQIPVHWWHTFGEPLWYYRLLPLIEGGDEGSAFDLVNFTDAIPDNEMIFGYSTEASGAKRATGWRLVGGVAFPDVLPSFPGGGESVALGAHSPHEGNPHEYIAAGWAEGPLGSRKAVAWIFTGGEWGLLGLPDLGGGLESTCNDIMIDGADTEIFVGCGWVENAEGNRLPSIYSMPDGGGDPLLHLLPLLEGGANGEATSLKPGGQIGDEIVACGWSEIVGGDQHAARWRSTDGGQTWNVHDLGMLPGYSNSAACGLTQWPGGSFIVGESGPPTSAGEATLWLRDEGEPPTIQNLNDLVVGPNSLTLRTANSVVVDGPQTIIAGEGVGVIPGAEQRRGTPHAYVLVQLDPSEVGDQAWVTTLERSRLIGATPNPFIATTAVSFDLPFTAFVHLSVLDVLGRTITTLTDGYWEAGRHSVSWNGKEDSGKAVSTGICFLRLECDGIVETRKIIRKSER
ncbi:hypothetical protein ACFL6M_06030 [Candidatus Eisenbacteria bacterium]|uniref:FlgD Ig-like domain-containing protein n=1 Tax=Eiseniibacteriota bacterium TaxID=2212470 RepID=A0ABV6YLD0_UNCEI